MLAFVFTKPVLADISPTPSIKKEFKVDSATSTAKKEINRERINEHFEIIKESLDTRYQFLLKIKTKVQERLGDNTEAKDKFAEIAKNEENYLNDLNNFEDKLGEILSAETPGKIIPELRTAVKAARTDLNDIHKILADTIKLLISETE